MKDWELEEALQDVDDFRNPQITLEQYATPPELAKHVIMTAARSYGDIEGAHVLDLGCGTGRLGIGAALLGAAHVVGVDVCPAALQTARENAAELEVPMEFVRCDVSQRCPDQPEAAAAPGPDRLVPGPPPFEGLRPGVCFDSVVMNPPFGANRDSQERGIDMCFLLAALRLCRADGAVYSLHKSSTRDFIARVGEKWGVKAEPLGEYSWPLASTYKHHRKGKALKDRMKSKDIQVDLWRFSGR
eukprot:TRINITY_DN13030_c0_g1_i1.p1 TRINITY_DN13030_c0_g1~~TRINITY_DN13030_c0_g1_i1.p1  ORF type:complete len:244 (+),score=74.05 TRINITY_DN13030_c0_g1_i1:88-819(+)